jgi:hypothetical protein
MFEKVQAFRVKLYMSNGPNVERKLVNSIFARKRLSGKHRKLAGRSPCVVWRSLGIPNHVRSAFEGRSGRRQDKRDRRFCLSACRVPEDPILQNPGGWSEIRRERNLALAGSKADRPGDKIMIARMLAGFRGQFPSGLRDPAGVFFGRELDDESG